MQRHKSEIKDLGLEPQAAKKLGSRILRRAKLWTMIFAFAFAAASCSEGKEAERVEASELVGDYGGSSTNTGASIAAIEDDILCRVGSADCLGSRDGDCCVPNVDASCAGAACGHCSAAQANGSCWQDLVASANVRR